MRNYCIFGMVLMVCIVGAAYAEEEGNDTEGISDISYEVTGYEEEEPDDETGEAAVTYYTLEGDEDEEVEEEDVSPELEAEEVTADSPVSLSIGDEETEWLYEGILSSEDVDTPAPVSLSVGGEDYVGESLSSGFEAELDVASPVNFQVGGDETDAKSSAEIVPGLIGEPYVSQKYESEEEAASRRFPRLGIPYTIRTDIQEEAIKLGY